MMSRSRTSRLGTNLFHKKMQTIHYKGVAGLDQRPTDQLWGI